MITITAAADLAGKSPTLIRRAMREGKIAGEKITNRMWLVDEASLREWMKQPRQRGNPNWRKMKHTTFINKTQLKKVNRALEAAGYSGDTGDRTAAQPEGCGSGYAVNIIERMAGSDPDARKEVTKIIEDVLNK